MKKISLIFFLSLITVTMHAQFVDYGSDPAKLKWNIVKTDNYKLIYPQGYDSMAYRYALFLENTKPHVAKTIGMPKMATFRIPVVLHTHNMLSNGMVAWAPRRMELITTPSPDLLAQNYDKHLVLHESRHVMQTGKLFQGIFSPLYYLFGEQISGVVAYGIPKWFFEGDAVATETAMSNSGRGRQPEFNMAFRTQLLSGDFYSFDKWFLGSYKDYTGNFYSLGYHMTAYARHAFGADVWDKVTTRYAKRIVAIPPFSNALKHYTGLNTKQLFNNTFDYLQNEWQSQQDDAYNHPPEYLSGVQKFYTSYNHPQPLNDNTIVAVKSGLSDINSITAIINGNESRITYIGNINSRLLVNNNRIYWSEYVSGLRWTHENYSVIKYYDFSSKKTVTLTPRQRYLSPALDKNGKQIAVSEILPEGKTFVVLLEAATGKEINRYPVLANAFIKEIAFGDNDNIIVTVVTDEGISLLQLDLEKGSWHGIMRPTNVSITSPVLARGKLFFESGLNGINNIYYLDTLTLQSYKLTSSRFGAFSPTLSYDGEHLLYNEYSPNGYRVATIAIDNLNTVPADFKKPYLFSLAETVKQQEDFNLDSVKLTPVKFEPKRYKRGLNLFKIHSWAPFYYDVSDLINLQTDDFSTIVKPGATVLSQNSLNTAIAQAGWYYKKGYHHGKFSFIYKGWYPVIDFNVDYGDKAFEMKWVQAEDVTGVISNYTNRNLVEAEARIYVPFNLTCNHYIRGFQPSVSYNYTNNSYQQLNGGKMRDFQYLLSELRFYNYRRLAVRDILPRWGYQIRLQHLATPADNKNFGSLYTARLITYLPGLIRNDGLMLRFGYQYQSVNDKAFYVPKRILDEPRGYVYNARTRQQLMFKADYAFNILCPDFAIASLAYVKRIRANVFYDISRNQANELSGWTNQSAYGADIIFDGNIFRLNYPLSFGVRLIQPIDYGNFQTEVLFSIAFQ